MVASQTTLPVIGVPIQSKALQGIDSLLSIVQMPKGVPTATMAIGKAGAVNAGLFAANILSTCHEIVAKNLEAYRNHLRQSVTEMRSEEHTSELQSRFDLVCRLMLEKKKKR